MNYPTWISLPQIPAKAGDGSYNVGSKTQSYIAKRRQREHQPHHIQTKTTDTKNHKEKQPNYNSHDRDMSMIAEHCTTNRPNSNELHSTGDCKALSQDDIW